MFLNPNLVPVAVVAPIGNSDHSSLSAVISMGQAVPNLCISSIIFLKHQVSWNTECGAIWDLPWRNNWLADNPVEVLNEHLSLLVGHYGWMINAGLLLASNRRLIFGGHEIALAITGKSSSASKC